MTKFVNKTFVNQTCHLVLDNFFLFFFFFFYFLHRSIGLSIPNIYFSAFCNSVLPCLSTDGLERHSAHDWGTPFFDSPCVLIQWITYFGRYFILNGSGELIYIWDKSKKELYPISRKQIFPNNRAEILEYNNTRNSMLGEIRPN